VQRALNALFKIARCFEGAQLTVAQIACESCVDAEKLASGFFGFAVVADLAAFSGVAVLSD
jgi:hypothetical protein